MQCKLDSISYEPAWRLNWDYVPQICVFVAKTNLSSFYFLKKTELITDVGAAVQISLDQIRARVESCLDCGRTQYSGKMNGTRWI